MPAPTDIRKSFKGGKGKREHKGNLGDGIESGVAGYRKKLEGKKKGGRHTPISE